MRVLVIEHQPSSCRLACSHIGKQGFTVDPIVGRDDAFALIAENSYEIVLLDLAPPVGDGAGFVRQVRREAGVPVIVLAAHADAAERIGLLEAGADDCLVRPFDLDELVARMRVCTRRGRLDEEQPVTFGDLSFYPSGRRVIVGEQPVMLRTRELALLEALLRGAGQPIHRDQLMSRLYSADRDIGSNSLDVHVHQLRRRLAEAGARVGITTVRGLGYALQVRDC